MEFFRNLENKCGIRLENIVYYKVQQKSPSVDFFLQRTSPTTLWWLQRRIVWWEKKSYEKTQVRGLTSNPNITEHSHTWFADDRESLLHPDNVNFEALKQYASEAASFSTSHFSTPLPTTPLAEWKGREDVSIFDFTHIYSSQVPRACT